MATELAKAYVQIIPSAEGIKGRITEALGGEASSAGEASGQTFGQKMTSAIKKIVAVAGIGKAFAESLNQGAELQQSIGGIETLFGDSADKVKAYAAQAYKTAGLSANEYMQTVTGFSASLLQSMANDTEAAAEKADMALTDMSDNANKMGTSMEDIQHAYQGFAKQNYTMLDNLKLGYGGTQAEMQRLLEDAQAISGIEYDISSYADIVDAIHVIQKEMDITGTTAHEAATTFSGSLASMKAAAKDLLGNLSLGEDIGPSLNALLETTQTFLVGNLLPMVGNILTELPGLAVSLIAGAGNLFVQLAAEIPGLVSDILENIRGLLVSGLEAIGLDGAAEMLAGLSNPLKGFSFQDLLDKFGEVADFLSETFSPVLDAVDDLFIAIDDAVGPVIDNIADFVTSEETASAITDTLSTAVETVAAGLETAVTWLTDFITWVTSGTPGAEAFKAVIVAIAAGFAAWQIIGTISTLVTTVTSVISAAKTAFSAFSAVLAANPIGAVITVIAGLAAGFIYLWNNCEEFRNFWIGLWENIKTAIEPAVTLIRDNFAKALENLQGPLDTIKEAFGRVKDAIANDLVPVLKEWLLPLWDLLKAALMTVATALGGAFAAALAVVTGVINGIVSAVSGFATAISGCVEVITSVFDLIVGIISGNKDLCVEALNGILDGAVKVFGGLWDAVSGFLQGFVDGVVGFFQGLWDTLVGHSIVPDTINGVINCFGGLWDGVSGFVGDFVDGVTAAFTSAKDWVVEKATGLKDGAIAVFGTLQEGAGTIWEGIKTGASEKWEAVKTTVGEKAAALKESASSAFSTLKENVSNAADKAKETASKAWTGLQKKTSTIFTSVKNAAGKSWDGIKSTVSKAADGVKSSASKAWDGMKTAVSKSQGSIKTTTSTAWNSIKSTTSSAWNGVKTAVSNPIAAIKSTISTGLNSAKSTVTAVWNGIKSVTATAWNGVKTAVFGPVNAVKSTISTGLSSAKSAAASQLDGIKSKFSSVFSSVKSTVSSAISYIKSKMKFTWSLPKLKMPHISIKGSFSLTPPSVPKFSISWYKSAMDNPLLLTNASIFGTAGGSLLAGGEAGPEVVSGADTLMSMMRSVLNEGTTDTADALNDKFDRMLELLTDYLPQLANMRVYLDKTAMVGQMAPVMDTALGKLRAKGVRQG